MAKDWAGWVERGKLMVVRQFWSSTFMFLYAGSFGLAVHEFGFGRLIAAAIMMALAPMFFVLHMLISPRRLKRMRLQAGLCVECGYDLRATPERCPECGLEMPERVGSA